MQFLSQPLTSAVVAQRQPGTLRRPVRVAAFQQTRRSRKPGHGWIWPAGCRLPTRDLEWHHILVDSFISVALLPPPWSLFRFSDTRPTWCWTGWAGRSCTLTLGTALRWACSDHHRKSAFPGDQHSSSSDRFVKLQPKMHYLLPASHTVAIEPVWEMESVLFSTCCSWAQTRTVHTPSVSGGICIPYWPACQRPGRAAHWSFFRVFS